MNGPASQLERRQISEGMVVVVDVDRKGGGIASHDGDIAGYIFVSS